MQVGDHKSALIHFGDIEPTRETGTVTYIHPQRRFYTVEFNLPNGRTISETYYFPSHGGGREGIQD